MASKAIGTYEDLLARCEDYGDCMLWSGRMVNGSPLAWNGERYVQARRMAYELTTGAKIPKGSHPVMKCREPGCLNHDHILLLTNRQIGALAAKEGKFSGPQRRAAVLRGILRAGRTKLDAEIARAIRHSTESGPALARKYGVNRSLVTRIKRGQAWREVTAGASVFNLGG